MPESEGMNEEQDKPSIGQPDPIKNDTKPVWDSVIDDMQERDAIGCRKYGVPLQARNGRNALQDAYEESLDQSVYLKQAVIEKAAYDAVDKVLIDHLLIVMDLAADPDEIKKRLNALTPDGINAIHAAIGISTEAGELLDAVKKLMFYGTPVDRVNVIEELGDLEFYMALARVAAGVSRADVLRANLKKLRKRYPSGTWKKEHAEKRDLEAEREALADATGVPE